MTRSRLPHGTPQLPLEVTGGTLRREVALDAVHVPQWLDLAQQRHLVRVCRRWAAGPVPMRAARLPNGGQMSVRTVCLGWHWQPYRYTRTADAAGGGAVAVAALPQWLADLGRDALATAYNPSAAACYRPDTALINYYDDAAALGMHQDKEERAPDPVVSLSIGDSCRFRLGNTQDRGRPWTDVELASGDLLMFGGPSRHAFHGVPRVFPGTADPRCGLSTGRINITLRVTDLTGLTDPPAEPT